MMSGPNKGMKCYVTIFFSFFLDLFFLCKLFFVFLDHHSGGGKSLEWGVKERVGRILCFRQIVCLGNRIIGFESFKKGMQK